MHPDPAQAFGFDRGRRVLMQDSFPATRTLFDDARASVTLNGLADPEQALAQMLAFARTPFSRGEGNRFVVLGLAVRCRTCWRRPACSASGSCGWC